MPPGRASRPKLSLKGRALKLLAQREHSRVELRRKLQAGCEDAAELDGLLDTLQRDGLLSDVRFAQSLARRRSPKYGARALAYELGEHRLAPSLQAEVLADAKAQEPNTLRTLWERRFGRAPATPEEHARQARYFLTRGFDAELVHRMLRQVSRPE